MHTKGRHSKVRGALLVATRSLTSLALCASMGVSGLVGCDNEEPEADGEEPFSLGGKADSTCPVEAPLCWADDDILTMKEILKLEDDVLFGLQPKQALTTMVDRANFLEHKLPDESLMAMEQISAEIAELPDGDYEIPDVEFDGNGSGTLPPSNYRSATEVLTHFKRDVIEPAEGAYYLANVVPVGQQAEAEGEKADETTPGAEADLTEFGELSDGQKRSLQMLYDSGVIGASIATVYKMTGVLERDYEVINADNFGELLPDGRIRPSGITREKKADIIIRKYIAASAAVGAGAGLVSLVPVAGTALAISGETVMLLKLHAQMTFEIGGVYGWDVAEGENLYLLSTMLMTEGLAVEAADIFISNYLVPLLARKMATKFGIELGTDLAGKLASRSISTILQIFSRKAQEQLAEQALTGTAKGIGKTVLGWATLGAAIIVSAAADGLATWALGEHVEAMSKRWLHDLMFEGSSYLSRQENRDCAFRALSAMAWEDGEVVDEEKSLFTAFLAKPYSADEQTWFHLGDEEVERIGGVVATWPLEDSKSSTQNCLERRFEDSDEEHRISLLGHMYSMMLIDGNQDDKETELYEAYREGLDGDGWFDGSHIDEAQMDYVERAIFLTANPQVVLEGAADEHAELSGALLHSDVFEFLKTPNEATEERFDCGFLGGC